MHRGVVTARFVASLLYFPEPAYDNFLCLNSWLGRRCIEHGISLAEPSYDYDYDYGHGGVCCGDDDNFLASIVGWADDALSTESHWLNHLMIMIMDMVACVVVMMTTFLHQ
jgi:hypothetical protein